MKWFLVFCLLFVASCTSQTTTLLSDSSSDKYINIAPKETPKPSATMKVQPEIEEFGYCKDYQQIELPKTNSPIGKIDFKNLNYPKIWQKGFVKLKNRCFGDDAKNALSGCEYTLD